MRNGILVLFVVLILTCGCQSTGKLETSVTPYNVENMEVKVVVEFKSK